MRDLKYFQTVQRPAWAATPDSNITWSTQSTTWIPSGDNKVLLGNASVVFSYSEGPSTCIWGQNIIIDSARNWLLVDGDKIYLPRECYITPEASSTFATPSSAPYPTISPTTFFKSTDSYQSIRTPVTPHFFQQAHQVPSSEPTMPTMRPVLDKSYHPPGIKILNVEKTGKITSKGIEMVETGDVYFKSGEHISLDVYRAMSDEERERRNNSAPTASMHM